MKTILFVLSALLGLPAFSAEVTKKMVCRGSQLTRMIVGIDNTFQLPIYPAQNPSPMGIGPGTCAFQDRVIAPDEPKVIIVEIPKGSEIVVYAMGAGPESGWRNNRIEIKGESAWLRDLMSSKEAVEIPVTRDGNVWRSKPSTL